VTGRPQRQAHGGAERALSRDLAAHSGYARRMRTCLAGLFVAILAAACAGEPPQPDAEALLARAWQLRAIGDEPVGVPPAPALRIDPDGRVGGGTGCNQFGGRAELHGRQLRFGPLIATKRACPAPVMDQERRFLAALEQVAGWRVAGDQLHLLDEAGGVLLSFRAS
jgi:heat shock protein HslJ